MKSQFKLMSLALIVFASNVNAAKYDFKVLMTNIKNVASANAKTVKASFAKANGKKAAKVIVPLAAVATLYKLNKAGKLEAAKAKVKSAYNKVATFVKTNKKAVAASTVATAAVSAIAYNQQAIRQMIARRIMTGKFTK